MQDDARTEASIFGPGAPLEDREVIGVEEVHGRYGALSSDWSVGVTNLAAVADDLFKFGKIGHRSGDSLDPICLRNTILKGLLQFGYFPFKGGKPLLDSWLICHLSNSMRAAPRIRAVVSIPASLIPVFS